MVLTDNVSQFVVVFLMIGESDFMEEVLVGGMLMCVNFRFFHSSFFINSFFSLNKYCCRFVTVIIP